MNIITYDDLDFNKVSMPPRSILYNLEPMGLGTPYVESLTSYISRLAESHYLKVTTLVGKTFTPLVKKNYLEKAFKSGGFGSTLKKVNGKGAVSLEYISVLEELTTRKDLIYLTMNSWSGLFSDVTSDTRKWCPICLGEWKDKGEEVYEPLIWYIKGIYFCDRHYVKLRDRCQNCGRKLQFLHKNLQVGHCQYCFNWLGDDNQKEDSINLTLDERFLLNNYKTLIEKAQGLISLPTNIKIGFILNKIKKDNKFDSIDASIVSWTHLS